MLVFLSARNKKCFDRHRNHCEGIAVVAAEDEAAHEVEEGREDLEPAQAVDRLSLATWTKSEQFGLWLLRITNCRKREMLLFLGRVFS